MTEMQTVVRAAAEAARGGEPAALATIVGARGSTPRGVGSRMLIVPRRGIVGTVGGGCGEAQVIEEAAAVIASGVSRMVHVDLTEDLLSWSPAVCGGVLEIFLEPVVVGTGDPSTRASDVS
jgi:xanthine/CO dehydrogenase XdhC/CoxF family maturation factor